MKQHLLNFYRLTEGLSEASNVNFIIVAIM